MFQLRFNIENPYWDRFESIRIWHGKTFFKHKFWECQILKSDDIFAFDLRINFRTDHAGLDLWLGLFGYSVNCMFYDHRHWNSEEQRYFVFDETKT